MNTMHLDVISYSGIEIYLFFFFDYSCKKIDVGFSANSCWGDWTVTQLFILVHIMHQLYTLWLIVVYVLVFVSLLHESVSFFPLPIQQRTGLFSTCHSIIFDSVTHWIVCTPSQPPHVNIFKSMLNSYCSWR